jgi:predicted nucleotidyltransferase
LFAAVREVVRKTDGLASAIKGAVGEDGIEFAVVFGSIAEGSKDAYGDIDLLVVARPVREKPQKCLREAAGVRRQ